jgi:multisubunit Na+/H+ antiporter MnhB subunit
MVNQQKPGMSLIVKILAYWLKSFIFLYGAYLALYGHSAPGGGFAGGMIIASSLIFSALVYGLGKDKNICLGNKFWTLNKVRLFTFTGVVLIAVWQLGVLLPQDYFAVRSENFYRWLTLIGDLGLCMLVSMSVFMAFSIMAKTRVKHKNGQLELISGERT